MADSTLWTNWWASPSLGLACGAAACLASCGAALAPVVDRLLAKVGEKEEKERGGRELPVRCTRRSKKGHAFVSSCNGVREGLEDILSTRRPQSRILLRHESCQGGESCHGAARHAQSTAHHQHCHPFNRRYPYSHPCGSGGSSCTSKFRVTLCFALFLLSSLVFLRLPTGAAAAGAAVGGWQGPDARVIEGARDTVRFNRHNTAATTSTDALPAAYSVRFALGS